MFLSMTLTNNTFNGNYTLDSLMHFDLVVFSMYILQKCYIVLYAFICQERNSCEESMTQNISNA